MWKIVDFARIVDCRRDSGNASLNKNLYFDNLEGLLEYSFPPLMRVFSKYICFVY